MLIEESNNLDMMSIDELQSSLLVHEQRMRSHGEEEQVLKISHEDKASRGRGRGRGNGSFRGGRRRGRQLFNKVVIECFKCHKLGHYQYKCSDWEKNANYVELEKEKDEELLLMSYVELEQDKMEVVLRTG